MEKVSMSHEDYLEAIVMLGGTTEKSVRSVDIANQMNVSKASVNKAIGLLKEKGLAEQPYYGDVTLTEEGYEYRFTSLKRMKKKEYGYFSLSDKGGPMEGVTLKEDDFPIIIRNAREKDHISMRYGKRKLNRFFIDAKIPLRKRLTWPVMVNREGNVILVPGIGCDRLHYSEKHNMFMIEL